MNEPSSSTSHRIIIQVIRARIVGKYGTGDDIRVADDITRLDEAAEAHIRARTAYSTHNSDETMINLVGTWSRVARVIRELEIKYA